MRKRLVIGGILATVMIGLIVAGLANAKSGTNMALLETTEGVFEEFIVSWDQPDLAWDTQLIADPVISGNGELRHQETDFEVPSRGFPFRFTRVYRSRLEYNGPLGHRWDFNYNQHVGLTMNVGQVQGATLFDGAGRSTEFTSVGGGIYNPNDSTACYRLEGVSADSTLITRRTSNLYEFDYGFIHTLSSGYRCYYLSAIRDRFNNQMTFSYNGNNQLTQIVDTEGRNYYLFYNAQGYLERLSDVADGQGGRTIDYDVDENGDLVEVEEFPANAANPDLHRVTEYSYVPDNDPTHLLYTVKAPREVASSGNPYLINLYDGNGRVYMQQNGTGYHVMIYHINHLTGRVASLWHFDRSSNQTDMIFEATGGALSTLIRHDGGSQYETNYEYNNGRLSAIFYPAADPNGAPSVRRTKRFYYLNTDPLTRNNLSSIVVSPATYAQETDLVWVYGSYDGTWTDTPVYQRDPDGYETLTSIVHNVVTGTYTVSTTFKKQNEATQATKVTVLDAQGRMTSVTNPESETNTISYDGTSGRVAAIYGSEGNVYNPILSFTYDTYGNVLTRTDSRGYVTTLVHNARNNLTDIYYPGGENYHAEFVYDANDRVIERTVPVRSGVTRHETIDRDIHGNVTKVEVEKTGSQDKVDTQTAYDLSERPVRFQDEVGRVTSLEWTARGQIKKIKFDPGASQGVIEYQYDHENRRAVTTDMRGEDWVTEYDDHGRVKKSLDPLNNYLEYAYSGTLTSLVTRFGSDQDTIYRQTKTFYDKLKRIEKIEKVAKKEPFSKQVSGTNLDYSGDGWLTTRFEYDLAGRLTKVYDELNRWTELQYDNLGRRTAEIHQTGNKWEYTYVNHTQLIDEKKLTEKTASTDKVSEWEYTYDALGRPTSVEDPADQTTTTTYNFSGQILTNTDPLSNQVVHNRNLLGWVLQTDVIGSAATLRTVHYDYDASGLLILATDPEGKQTSLAYDSRGRLVQRKFVPENKSYVWHYNIANQVTSLVDPRDTVFYYHYNDDRGLLTSIVIQAGGGVAGDTGTIVYQYDAVGLLTTVWDGDSKIWRTHNTLGQVMTESQCISYEAMIANPPYYRTVNSYFDGAGRRRKIDYPEPPGEVDSDTFILHYDYDALDRLTTLQRQFAYSTSGIASYQYEGFSRLSKAFYANDTQLRLQYDLRNFITKIGHYRNNGNTEEKIFEAERLLDPVGRPTWRKVDYYDPNSPATPYYSDVARYYYDAASRVNDAYHGINLAWPPASYNTAPPNFQSRRQYTLNDADTRDTVYRWEGGQEVSPDDTYTRGQGAGHEYTQAVIDQITHTFSNDTAGNRSQHQRQSGQLTQTVTYQYDAFNRLVSASSGGTKSITWRHDPFGRVIEEKRVINESSEIIRYYHDGDSAVQEVSVASEAVPSGETKERRYLFGPEGAAPFFGWKEAGANDIEAFFHTDEQGSVLGLTSHTGGAATVLEHYRYHRDFGEVTLHNGVSGTAATNILSTLFGQPYLWKGGRMDRWMFDQFQHQQLDPKEWLLYHMGDRDYDPWSGAYLQRASVGRFAGRGFENPASVLDDPVDGSGGSPLAGAARIGSPVGWPGPFAQKGANPINPGVDRRGDSPGAGSLLQPPGVPGLVIEWPDEDEDTPEDRAEDEGKEKPNYGGGILRPISPLFPSQDDSFPPNTFNASNDSEPINATLWIVVRKGRGRPAWVNLGLFSIPIYYIHVYLYDDITGNVSGLGSNKQNETPWGSETISAYAVPETSDPNSQEKVKVAMDWMDENANKGEFVPCCNDCRSKVKEALDQADLHYSTFNGYIDPPESPKPPRPGEKATSESLSTKPPFGWWSKKDQIRCRKKQLKADQQIQRAYRNGRGIY